MNEKLQKYEQQIDSLLKSINIAKGKLEDGKKGNSDLKLLQVNTLEDQLKKSEIRSQKLQIENNDIGQKSTEFKLTIDSLQKLIDMTYSTIKLKQKRKTWSGIGKKQIGGSDKYTNR